MNTKPLLLASLLAASFPAFSASDADLAAIRAQLNELKQSYEQRIVALEQKLAEARQEGRPAQSSPASAAHLQTASSAAPSAASAFNPEVSLILQGQYKSMKEVSGRGITGFWPAAGHDHAAGTVDAANKRGFSVDHTELVLAANIDPYWRGQAIIAALDGTAEVEEAWFQSLGLGNGLGLKAGRFRSGIGYLNEQHAHAWDFADAPLMYQALFGEHGSYAQDGVQVKWLAPTDLFFELGAELGRGQAFPGTDRNRNGKGATALFAHLGGELGVAHQWRAGLSYLKTAAQGRIAEISDANAVAGEAALNADSRTLIADFVWKWAPNGNPKYQNFKFQTEYFARRESGEVSCAPETAGSGEACASTADSYRSRQSGFYAQGVYQFTPNWRAGVRHEQLSSGNTAIGALAAAEIGADNGAFKHYSPRRTALMVDYSWSEFSRVRLQYSQDKSMQGLSDNQLILQYVMSLGSHGAHKF